MLGQAFSETARFASLEKNGNNKRVATTLFGGTFSNLRPAWNLSLTFLPERASEGRD